MPELPFLEILAENLAARVSGRRILAIHVRQPALLQNAAPGTSDFVGEYLSLPVRQGKYLILETESRRAIVFHLMRAGRLEVVAARGDAARAGAASRGAAAARAPKNVSARIQFDDGSELRLLEHGTEKRARMWLANDVAEIPEIAAIGPDPSRGQLTWEKFFAALRGESRQLKTFLTDQRAIAGIGNGLSDEILFEARLSPMKLTRAATEAEARALHAAVLSVVAAQVEALRGSATGELPRKEPREHYAVHDHAGTPCPRCGTLIAKVSYVQRETFYCPGCQTGGKPLADRRFSRLVK